MKTVDIVMPTGAAKGGVAYVINAWTKSILSEKYDLRVFHVIPGKDDYLEGYEKQWTVAVDENDDVTFDIQYCVECYAEFIANCGVPDICIATWIPMMTTACNIVRESLKLDFKLVSWLHSGIGVYKDLGWGGVENLLFADAHLCLSGQTAKEITDTYPNAKVFVVGNPVNKPAISVQSSDPHKICFVGRIDIEKKLDVILRAISLARDESWAIAIAGDGDLMRDMKNLVHSLDINRRVEFLGWRDNPWNDVKDASFLAIASDFEGFSITALEASSLGMTVITTPVSGCTDYIVPGVNGYFFDNSDPKNLADILDYISDGVLPICDRGACMNSVTPYLTENYFLNVVKCLESIGEM